MNLLGFHRNIVSDIFSRTCYLIVLEWNLMKLKHIGFNSCDSLRKFEFINLDIFTRFNLQRLNIIKLTQEKIFKS
jgi:hypothetical protein